MNPEIRARFIIEIPQSNTTFNEVCQIQSVKASNTGIYIASLNGTIGKNFINLGYSRSVTIVSHGDDLSAGTFTVTGFQNGAYVTTGLLQGPGPDEIIDTKDIPDAPYVFDSITSIEVSDNLLGDEFSVGSGGLAYSRPQFVNWSNPNTNLMSYGLSVRNPALARTILVHAAQVFTYGVPFATQIIDLNRYGLYQLPGTGDTREYLYRGMAAPVSADAIGVGFPLWDAFIVSVDFSLDAEPVSTWVVFPQIGR